MGKRGFQRNYCEDRILNKIDRKNGVSDAPQRARVTPKGWTMTVEIPDAEGIPSVTVEGGYIISRENGAYHMMRSLAAKTLPSGALKR